MPFFNKIKLPKITIKQIAITLLIVIPLSYFSIPVIRKVYESFQIVFDPQFANLDTKPNYLYNEGRGILLERTNICNVNLDEYISSSQVPKDLSDKIHKSFFKENITVVDAYDREISYNSESQGNALILVKDKNRWDGMGLKEKKVLIQNVNNTFADYFNNKNYTTVFVSCNPNANSAFGKVTIGYIQNIKGKENISIGEW